MKIFNIFRKKVVVHTPLRRYDPAYDRQEIQSILTEACSRLYDKGVIPHEYAIVIAQKLLRYHNEIEDEIQKS